jgi:rRNA maturation protein Nop10
MTTTMGMTMPQDREPNKPTVATIGICHRCQRYGLLETNTRLCAGDRVKPAMPDFDPKAKHEPLTEPRSVRCTMLGRRLFASKMRSMQRQRELNPIKLGETNE